MSGSQGSSARRTAWPLEERRTRAGSDAPGAVGAAAAAHWLRGLRLSAPATTRWHVEIAMDVVDGPAPAEPDPAIATRFHLDIYAEEWGVFFCHAGRSSWIRVTDIAFVHGRDDFGLLPVTPPLKDVATLLRRLEQQHGVQLRRDHALIRTNLAGIEPALRRWILSL